MLGRTNTIKRIFLPQPFYLLQNTPMFMTRAFFKHLDSIILPFVWDYKIHRIKKAHLCKSKVSRRLALPHFTYYHWATKICSIGHWLDDTAVLPDGLEMEREDCLPFTVSAVSLTPVPLSKPQ